MFEEDLCLQCGAKPCAPSSVYCSGVCAELDAAPSSPALSPSQSTASSAFPSPSLPPSLGSNYNIPPLALDRAGAALKSRADVWDDSDSDISEPPFALSYARRPSATNHRSTIPLLTHSKPSMHRRGSSSLSSDISVSPSSSAHTHTLQQSTITARKRANRASLPAHFQLLQTAPSHSNSPSLRATRPGLAIPSMALSGAHSRVSPSTPKLAGPAFDITPALAGASPSSAPMASIASTYANEERGRRREPGSSRRRESSRSVSRSRNRSRSRSRPSRNDDDDARGRRRAGGRDWVGARDYGFGHGRTGLIAREAEGGRGRAR
ncbi:hypothetical protein PENSPDRAFT_671723 [Peniophora sp. CONT]|nr:hypothetical protein PENSPDRAFT_671723 [Peniophora sp. CONT]